MSDSKKIRLIINKILKEQFDAIKAEEVEAPVKTPTETPTPKKRTIKKPKIHPGSNPMPKAEGVEAPVKTPTETPTETPTPKRRTIKKPKIHPGSNPQPKANFLPENMMEQYKKEARRMDEMMRMKRLISEAPMNMDSSHEERPDPSLRAGIEGAAETPFSSVELFHKGDLDYTTLEKLGSEEFNDVVREVLSAGKLSNMEIQQTLMMIMQIESGHTGELESLALNTVKRMFGLPDELANNIDVDLKGMNDGSITPPDDSGSGGDEEDYLIDDFTDEEQKIIKKSIDKRIVSNALMMGSGYKTHPVLKEIKSQLDAIDQRLYPLYTKIMPNMEFYLWKMPASFSTQGRTMLGRSELVFEEPGEDSGEEQSGEEQTGEPGENNSVREVKGAKAQAHLFPILLHEIAKAAVEYLFANGLPKYSEAMNKEIMSKSESYKDEHWMKLIGPRLWKHLHDAIDYIVKEEGDDYTIVAILLQELSTLEPDEFLSLMDSVLHDGPAAIETLKGMIDEIESDVDDYEGEHGTTPSPNDIASGEDNSHEISKTIQANIDDLLSNETGEYKSEKPLESMSADELNSALMQAIDMEDYKKASEIRDVIQGRS